MTNLLLLLLLLLLFTLLFLNCRGDIYVKPTQGKHKIDPMEAALFKTVQHVVSIRSGHRLSYWGDNHFCGGFLITASLVITSECCVVSKIEVISTKGLKNLVVAVGLMERLSTPLPNQLIEVEKYWLSSKTDTRMPHDLAILLLKNKVPMLRFFRYLQQLPLREIPDQVRCRTMGWGRLYPHGPFSNELLTMDLETINARHCVRQYGESFDPDMQICTVSMDFRGPMCQGDVGSPLLCGNVLYGVGGLINVSQCIGYEPIVFSSVYKHVRFIQDIMAGGAGVIRRRASDHLAMLLMTLTLGLC
ncbi:duodenase-1 [Drosophila willistoni]|uniref:duodenase-1 n=1 Tax=Drosophila willistoni TaxID=7260 RepID=UPI000C26CD82|nr:duodenase-1 [Drosophila willistoni]